MTTDPKHPSSSRNGVSIPAYTVPSPVPPTNPTVKVMPSLSEEDQQPKGLIPACLRFLGIPTTAQRHESATVKIIDTTSVQALIEQIESAHVTTGTQRKIQVIHQVHEDARSYVDYYPDDTIAKKRIARVVEDGLDAYLERTKQVAETAFQARHKILKEL